MEKKMPFLLRSAKTTTVLEAEEHVLIKACK